MPVNTMSSIVPPSQMNMLLQILQVMQILAFPESQERPDFW
jgi:hypothetical protein